MLQNIYDYEDGIAKVRWEVNPDGMYYRDEDGFGKTDDDEQNLFHNRFMEGGFLRNIILSKKNSKLRSFLLFLVSLQRIMP